MSSTTARTDSPPAPQDFDARAQETWERWLRVLEAVNLALFADRSPTQRLAGAISSIEQAWAKLRAVPGVTAESLTILATIEAKLRTVESETLSADGAIPTASFRQSFSETKVGYDTLIRYVQLLVSRLDSADRRDRVEFLATRLLSSATGVGQTKTLLPRASVDAVLRAICTGREVKAETRTAAVKHFEEAIQKVQGLQSVDDAFDGGLLLDVRGFKLSLGHDLIEPDILYAAVAFNVEIGNRLDLLMKEEGLPPDALASRNAALDKKLASIFKEQRSFAVPEPQKFAARKAPEKATRWAKPEPVSQPDRARRTLVLGGLLVVALGVRVGWSFLDFGPALTPMPASEAVALSPSIASASRASYDGDPGIEADLAPTTQWDTLTPDAKQKLATEIVQQLYGRKVFRGVLWKPGHSSVAVRFRGGDVVSVE